MFKSWIMQKLIIIPGILVGLSVHEFGHALVAKLCGDHTAESQGRVSLDPFDHVDWIGLVCLILFGFGWGKPVMVNPSNFKSPRRDSIFVGLAGVVMNLITAFIFAFILRFLYQLAPEFLFTSNVGEATRSVITGTVIINISLMLFNLIPLPPLDGFGIVSDIINLPKLNFEVYKWIRTYGSRILLVLVIFEATSKIISGPLYAIYNWIMDIAFIGL